MIDATPTIATVTLADVLWSQPRCPVVEREQHWVDTSMEWLRGEFGDGSLHRPVILPTDDYFPGAHTGTDGEVRSVVRRVCGYMGVDAYDVELDFYGEGRHGEVMRGVAGAWAQQGTAGHYRTRDGNALIGIEEQQAGRPMALVATIAHELGHHRLLGEGRITADRPDHEPLTDLLTVYLGLGIFTANAAYDFIRRRSAGLTGWSAQHLGYLTEPMFGYGLARFAWLRGERRPAWESFVDTNPRDALRKGLRFLWQHEPAESS
jgi:hypothetical protein